MQTRINQSIAQTKATTFFLTVVALLVLSISEASAQCSGCTTIISTNTACTVPAGQVVCITFAGTYNKAITLNGGTLCIGSSTTLNSAITYTSATTIINNGTVSNAIALGNGYSLTNYGSMSGVVTISNGGILNNTSTLASNITMTNGSLFINSGTYSGTLTNTGGNIRNSGTLNRTFTLNGILNNSAGATLVAGVTVASAASVVDSGTIAGTLTINSGGSVTIYNGGSISATSAVSGTLVNNGSITNSVSITATGSVTNTSSIAGNITSMALGASFSNSATGTFTGSIASSIGSTITNSGTMTILSGATLAGTFTINAGSTTNNSGSTTGAVTQNGGNITNYTGGSFKPSTFSITGAGTLVNNSGGTVQFAALVNFPSSYVFTNNGTVTIPGFTIQSGASATFAGSTQTITGNVINNGILSYTGTGTITGSMTQGPASTSNFFGNVTITSTYKDSGTTNLNSGNLTVQGLYSDAATTTVNATTSCSIVTLSGGYTSNLGSFNGNSTPFQITPAPGCASCLTNGAFGGATVAPTTQPSALSISMSGYNINGSFSGAVTAHSGYIVFRAIALSAPANAAPVNGTAYGAGAVLGSWTVVTNITDLATAAETYTDVIPAGNCGKTVYYQVMSVKGCGTNIKYYTTSPLSGNVAMPTPTVSNAGPAITQCNTSSFIMAANNPAVGIGSWSIVSGSPAISSPASRTTNVTLAAGTTATLMWSISANGCSVSTSTVVLINDAPLTDTLTATNDSYYGAYDGAVSNTAGGGSSPYTYLWNTAATTQNINFLPAGSYTVTVTDANNCTLIKTTTVTQPAQVYSPDVDPVNANLMTAPAGTYVIAMDNTLQNIGGFFNIKAYGLVTSMLNNQVALHWVIKTGKAKDAVDFSASATQSYPVSGVAAVRNFKAGPFLIFPQDTGTNNIQLIVNAFNAANSANKVNVYRLTSPTVVDVRYTLSQKPKTAILDDGGNANIHVSYMTTAGITALNYSVLASAVNLADSCYNFASEPHNSAPETTVLDSLKSYVVRSGGNIFLQCHAIWNYEDSTGGRFQTSTGVNVVNTSFSPIVYGHPDLTFQQYEGAFDPMVVGGSVENWQLDPGGVLTNNTQLFESGTGVNAGTIGQSMSKLGSGPGHLVFFSGGHNYQSTNNAVDINGMRSYFNAMLTPCAVTKCNFLVWNNDLAVTQTMSACNLYQGQLDTFTIIVKNNGPSGADAAGVLVNDILPASLSYVSSSTIKGSYNNSLGLWTVGTMALDESDTLQIIASANASGSFTNTVSLLHQMFDYNQLNDTARLSATIYGCTASAGPGATHCANSSFTMAANSPCSGTGTWSVISGSAAITSVNSPTTAVTVNTGITAVLAWTFNNGCGYSIDTAVLINHPLPAATITSSASDTFCAGASINLKGNGGGTYQWNAAGGSATTRTISVSTTGLYTVTVTTPATGCSASASVNVVVNPLPVVPAITGIASVCTRDTIVLSDTASGGVWTSSRPSDATVDASGVVTGVSSGSANISYQITNSYGCSQTVSKTVTVTNCTMSISGSTFDDANGNGSINTIDTATSLGQTLYAVLRDNTNKVIVTSAIAADGSFSFPAAPAYTSGMTVTVRTTNPTVGSVITNAQWPANWVGTKGQFGTNNLAGSGIYDSAGSILIKTTASNVTGLLIGYDRLPVSTNKTYTIARPPLNSYRAITASRGLGMFSGTDPEDGTLFNNSSFTITSLTGINGNKLFYDANGDGTLQSYEEITGYTVITNVDSSKFFVKFTEVGTSTMTFKYASTDAAGKVDPAPSTYTINWTGGSLPVKLISFGAEKYQESQALLKWSTASEINNDHFDIERSPDAKEWEKIGEVAGAGNSNATINYSLIDERPLTGTNYYRLKQVDMDGKFEYSEIASLTMEGNPETQKWISVYPTLLSSPVINISASLPNEMHPINIAVFDLSGKQIFTQTIQGNSVDMLYKKIELPDNLPKGIYIVKCDAGSATYSVKIVYSTISGSEPDPDMENLELKEEEK